MIVLVVLGIGFTVMIVGVITERRRRTAIAAQATDREWTFVEEDSSLVDAYPGPPFDRGRRREATNVVRGRYDGRDMLAFDHKYVSGSGDDARTHRHSIVAVPLGARFPSLSVAPEGVLSRMFGGFFGSDVEVGDAVFDAVFRVAADDPAYAREVLVPEVRAALLRHPELTWRLEADALMTIRDGQHGAGQIEPVLQAMHEALGAIPDRVWARVRGDA